jgi:hypothetical protein
LAIETWLVATERGQVEHLGDGVREEEDGPVEVVGHVDQLGCAEERERRAEQPQVPAERQPGKAGAERERRDVDGEEERRRQLVDPAPVGHVGLLVECMSEE